jgi:3-hydroxyisobutyrate dehydrogenase-like beta-hydroxyacid dehydrogenase
MDVGFLGLGHMGKAIAGNLLRAGHTLCVWNRSPGPAQELAARGARVAGEPAATARAAVLMTMLADDAALRAVLFGQRVLDSAEPGLIHVNLATVSVAFARELAELEKQRGVVYVAAPVFGRPEVAEAAKLNVVAAGPSAALAKIEPLLAAIGQRTWRLGDMPERASVVKLAGNFMIASALETMGEAAALVRAHGVGAGEFLEVLTNSLFAAPVYQIYGRLIAEQRYTPAAFKLSLGLKDVRLALEAADGVQVPLPFAAVLRDHFLEALATGIGEQDWAALAEISARHAGLPGTPAAASVQSAG